MQKRYFAKHAKSSAALISLGIHAVLIVIALSFVAVTVIQKEDQKFEAKKVTRPRIKLNKLQAPIRMEKKRKLKPKLRKRLIAKPKLNQKMPDIKMPEITGVKGGFGSGVGDGLGGSGGLGFSMPEIEMFGVKSKGEKVFIILDSTPWMMYDEIGGIPAYTVIKEELIKLLGGLNSTVLFNIAVYDHNVSSVLYPKLVPATAQNVNKVDEWLKPLNSVKKGMGDRDYGTHTLGAGGSRISGDFTIKPVETTRHWSQPAMLAMQQQADSVYVLTQGWGWLYHDKAPAKQWSASKRAKWDEIWKKANQKLKDENEQRRKDGDPPRVLVGWTIVDVYYPGTEKPPVPERYRYSPKEMIEALSNQRAAHKSKVPASSGVSRRRKKQDYSLNVIHFVRKDKTNEQDEGNFKQLTSIGNGRYKTLSGLDAIKKSASK